MANILGDDKRQQILALGRLGWPLRRIEEATGVRRETASGYLKAAGIAIRAPRRRRPPPKPASEVSTDPRARPPSLAELPAWPPPSNRAPTASACAPYRELIELALSRGRNAMAIWQDLVDEHGFPARYASVRRFVVKLRGQRTPDAHPVITTAPGEEGQVDYGEGPMVRHPGTGKYRRTRLFVFTLGFSRKSVRLLTFASSAQRCAALHQASGRRHVHRGTAASPTAAARALSLLPLRHPHRASRRLCRSRRRLLRPAAGLARPRGRRPVGRSPRPAPRPHDRRLASRAPASDARAPRDPSRRSASTHAAHHADAAGTRRASGGSHRYALRGHPPPRRRARRAPHPRRPRSREEARRRRRHRRLRRRRGARRRRLPLRPSLS